MVETRGGRKFAVLFIVAAFLILLLGRWLQPVDRVALSAAAPFNAAVSGISNWVGDTVTGVLQGPQLRRENETLRKQIGALDRQSIAYAVAMRENQHLKHMLRFEESNTHLDLVSSRVIGEDPNNLSPILILNHGSNDGLRAGMTVLDDNGSFVGTITKLTGNAAQVQLMLSPSSSVGAVDLRSGSGGLVEGRYSGGPQLTLVPTRASLQKGDVLVTSGQFNLFPRNILLGQVSAVQHSNSGLFQSATIQPATNFSDLEFVLVARNFQPSPPTSLMNKP
ncbi:MAG: rod shape-determining protein MreC [Chloroflexota bacterium]